MATLWCMLRDMHAQCPLDGTSETRSVLLRLLKDGFDGPVSVSALTRKKMSDEGQNKLFHVEIRQRGHNRTAN